jgi:hypothetical protein
MSASPFINQKEVREDVILHSSSPYFPSQGMLDSSQMLPETLSGGFDGYDGYSSSSSSSFDHRYNRDPYYRGGGSSSSSNRLDARKKHYSYESIDGFDSRDEDIDDDDDDRYLDDEYLRDQANIAEDMFDYPQQHQSQHGIHPYQMGDPDPNDYALAAYYQTAMDPVHGGEFPSPSSIALASMYNRDDIFTLSIQKQILIKNLGTEKWSMSGQYGGDASGDHAPYLYSGSPYHNGRAINRIVLTRVYNRSPVSVGIKCSLIHPKSREEMMPPNRPVLSSGTVEHGPSHVLIRPKQSIDDEIVLWEKDDSTQVPSIVIKRPDITDKDLFASLKPHPRDSDVSTLVSEDPLLQYVAERIKNGTMSKEDNPITWDKAGGFGIIDKVRARILVNRFIRDQSKDLFLKNLWDVYIHLNRGHSSPVKTKIPLSEDNSELLSEIPVISHTDPTTVSSMAEIIRNTTPYDIHMDLRVELEPDINRRGRQ